MKHLEDMVKDLGSEEKTALVGILSKSLVSDELAALEEQLKTTTSVPHRISIKQKISDLQNGR